MNYFSWTSSWAQEVLRAVTELQADLPADWQQSLKAEQGVAGLFLAYQALLFGEEYCWQQEAQCQLRRIQALLLREEEMLKNLNSGEEAANLRVQNFRYFLLEVLPEKKRRYRKLLPALPCSRLLNAEDLESFVQICAAQWSSFAPGYLQLNCLDSDFGGVQDLLGAFNQLWLDLFREKIQEFPGLASGRWEQIVLEIEDEKGRAQLNKFLGAPIRELIWTRGFGARGEQQWIWPLGLPLQAQITALLRDLIRNPKNRWRNCTSEILFSEDEERIAHLPRIFPQSQVQEYIPTPFQSGGSHPAQLLSEYLKMRVLKGQEDSQTFLKKIGADHSVSHVREDQFRKKYLEFCQFYREEDQIRQQKLSRDSLTDQPEVKHLLQKFWFHEEDLLQFLRAAKTGNDLWNRLRLLEQVRESDLRQLSFTDLQNCWEDLLQPPIFRRMTVEERACVWSLQMKQEVPKPWMSAVSQWCRIEFSEEERRDALRLKSALLQRVERRGGEEEIFPWEKNLGSARLLERAQIRKTLSAEGWDLLFLSCLRACLLPARWNSWTGEGEFYDSDQKRLMSLSERIPALEVFPILDDPEKREEGDVARLLRLKREAEEVEASKDEFPVWRLEKITRGLWHCTAEELNLHWFYTPALPSDLRLDMTWDGVQALRFLQQSDRLWRPLNLPSCGSYSFPEGFCFAWSDSYESDLNLPSKNWEFDENDSKPESEYRSLEEWGLEVSCCKTWIQIVHDED